MTRDDFYCQHLKIYKKDFFTLDDNNKMMILSHFIETKIRKGVYGIMSDYKHTTQLSLSLAIIARSEFHYHDFMCLSFH